MRLKSSSIVAACLIIPMLLTYSLNLTFKKYTPGLEDKKVVENTYDEIVLPDGKAPDASEGKGGKEQGTLDPGEVERPPLNEAESYRFGDTGDKIREIQRNLNRFNYRISVDGAFGKSTLWAVKDFQKRNKLPQDGVVEKETLYRLSLKPTKETTYVPPKENEKAISSTSTVEAFVNNTNLSSSTGYLIWVNTKTQHTYIFTGSSKEWKLHRDMRCATGKSSTPTVKGTFKVKSKGSYFRVNENVICKYYTQFYGDYLFHTVLLNNQGKVVDGRLGMKLSHGCVRLAIENAKYIYDNIPIGTTVYVN